MALDDHRKTVERMKDPSAHGVPLTKMSDEYALKEGEKISVDISGVAWRTAEVRSAYASCRR